jgi:hypothetical protein
MTEQPEPFPTDRELELIAQYQSGPESFAESNVGRALIAMALEGDQ